MLVSVLTALVLVTGPAHDQDGVVTTARTDAVDLTASQPIEAATPSSTVSSASVAATQALTTTQQIDRWLSAGRTGTEQPAWRDVEDEPRRMHGEVSVGVGSNDYSHASARVQMPLGENGTLSLGYSQTKNGWYERPMGVEGYFWSPADEVLGPRWVTPSGRSYSPLGSGRSLIDRPEATPTGR